MNHLYAPLLNGPFLLGTDPIHFKTVFVVKYSKKGEGKREESNPLQDVDKC